MDVTITLMTVFYVWRLVLVSRSHSKVGLALKGVYTGSELSLDLDRLEVSDPDQWRLSQ